MHTFSDNSCWLSWYGRGYAIDFIIRTILYAVTPESCINTNVASWTQSCIFFAWLANTTTIAGHDASEALFKNMIIHNKRKDLFLKISDDNYKFKLVINILKLKEIRFEFCIDVSFSCIFSQK